MGTESRFLQGSFYLSANLRKTKWQPVCIHARKFTFASMFSYELEAFDCPAEPFRDFIFRVLRNEDGVSFKLLWSARDGSTYCIVHKNRGLVGLDVCMHSLVNFKNRRVKGISSDWYFDDVKLDGGSISTRIRSSISFKNPKYACLSVSRNKTLSVKRCGARKSAKRHQFWTLQKV